MKKRRFRRFAAFLLVCLLVLGLVPARTEYSLYGAEASELDFTDAAQAETADVQSGSQVVQSGTVEASAEDTAGTPVVSGSGTETVQTAEPEAGADETVSFTDTEESVPDSGGIVDMIPTEPEQSPEVTFEDGTGTQDPGVVESTEPENQEITDSTEDIASGEEPAGEETEEDLVSSIPHNENNAAEDFSSGDGAAEETKEEPAVTEPSDGSLAGQEIHFVNLYWEDIDLGDIYALFQGGTVEDQEILMTRGERGKYTAVIPQGDYSRVSFCQKQEGEAPAPEVLLSDGAVENGGTAAQGEETVSANTEEAVTQEEAAVSQNTEEAAVQEETAASPETEEAAVPSETAPEVLGDGTAEEDSSAPDTAENELYGTDSTVSYVIYGTPFQYYGGQSQAPGCVAVAYAPGAHDTYYYDTMTPENSYWGADALYEPAANSISTYAIDPGQDKAGETFYFVDIADSTRGNVKRVTMQFYHAGHAADAKPEKNVVMYEGREHIFSAPIPAEGCEEVTFYLEYDNGDPYQMQRHFNFYADENSLDDPEYDYPDESFTYEAGVMDTYFYNQVGDPSYEGLKTCYWGPHPSVTDRSLDAQYFYISVKNLNGNEIILNPETITISYNGVTVDKDQLQPTRDPQVYAFQFPSNCGATEQTVITLIGKTAYIDKNTGTIIPEEDLGENQTITENVFRFYYPYNSSKKMIQADYFGDTEKHIFAEVELESEEQKTRYVFFDNTTTQFADETIYYCYYEDGKWVGSGNNPWIRAEKVTEANYEEIFHDPSLANKHILNNLFFAEVPVDVEYIQFQASYSKWRTTNEINEDSLARVPFEEFSFPCFYAAKTDKGESESAINLTGKWMSAFDVGNLASTDVPEGTFQKETDAYYGTSTLYDYYTDFELRGISLADNGAYSNMSNGKETLNQAISTYYKETGNKSVAPLYVADPGSSAPSLYNYNENLNHWTQSDNKTVTQGGVDSILGGNLTAQGRDVPLFNEGFLRGNNSYGAALGQVFQNVYFPFTKNDEGYWEFDSSKTEETLRLKYDVNHGYFLDRTGEDIWASSGDGVVTSFFPFNDSKDQGEYSVSLNPELVKDNAGNAEKKHLNYLFGTRFDIPFTLPEGNVVDDGKGNPVPVTFEFDGDDDAWIFIDGQLVLDMGGIHGSMKGTIDFQSKTAVIEAGRTGDGSPGSSNRPTRDLNGSETANEKKFNLDETKKEHTLTMFYMERGLGSSNLKITFNFPKQNALNVTNEIDTSAADEIFQEALDNIGSFSYGIKNKVTSGKSLPVDKSAGYVEHEEDFTWNEVNDPYSVTYNSGKTSVTSGGEQGGIKIKQNTSLTSSSEDEEIISNLVKIPFAGGKTQDISNETYFQFLAYNYGNNPDQSGESIYVVLEDANENKIGGWVNKTAYDDRSNSIGTGKWSLARIDINKLQYLGGSSSFDRKNVKYVAFAMRGTDPMGIKDIDFYKPVISFPTHGFSVEQEEISDYGSVTGDGSYSLSDVNGAWYGHYRNGVERSTYRMTENGFFSLGSGERAEFLDKFRAGSYLQITQEDIDPRVFTTTWSIRDGIDQEMIPENDLLPSRTDTDSVRNDGTVVSGNNYPQDSAYPLENVSGQVAKESGLLNNTPNDGRIAQDTQNGGDIEKPKGGSFVYRSYDNPDDNEINPINLTVAFHNVLRTGSVTIEKNLTAEEDANPAGAEFQFEITFTNIAGMNLEEAPITTVVTVTLDADGCGSTTFSGIPAGTEYTIREYKSANFALKDISFEQKEGIDAHQKVTINKTMDGEPLFAQATAYASDQVYMFDNSVKPIEMTIEKHWDDAGYEDYRPIAIGIQIQRRTADTEWENVTKTFYDKAIVDGENSYIRLTAENEIEGDTSIWKAITKELAAISDNGQVYTYRIQEIPLPNKGDEGRWHLDNYEASYIQGDPETGAYIVTNTPKSITVKKVWEDGDDPSRPVEIKVKLQRRLAGSSDESEWRDYVDSEGSTIEVTLSTHDNPQWTYVFGAIERVNERDQLYEYRAVETWLIYSDGRKVEVEEGHEISDDTTNQYKVSYSSNTDNTILTVTNSKDRGQVKILKMDRTSKNPLAGAEFTLERLKPRDGKAEEDTQFKVGEYNNELWMVDENYTSLKETTDENGMIDLGFLPYGYYRITEIKAPDGYMLLDEPYDFRITEDDMKKLEEDGKNYMTIELYNKSVITLPISGASGTAAFTAAGVVLIALAMILYRRHLRLKRIKVSKKRKRG